jgi:hypothetical protein
MTPKLKLNILKFLFKKMIVDVGGLGFFKFVSSDFLNVSINGMKSLFDENKNNLILKLSKCFEKVEGKEEEYRMPVDRMPFGLIDYNINFFSSQSSQKLGVEEHYVEWMSTMYAHFGKKWLHLFRGPVWQFEEESHSIIEDALLESGINLTCEEDVETVLSGMEVLDINIYNSNEVVHMDESMSKPTDKHVNSNDIEEYLDFDSNNLSTTEPTSISTNEDNPHINIESSNEADCELGSNNTATIESTSKLTKENPVSTLWTHVSSNEQDDIDQGFSHELENFHQIRPAASCHRKQNPGIYNPLKVCKLVLSYILMIFLLNEISETIISVIILII